MSDRVRAVGLRRRRSTPGASRCVKQPTARHLAWTAVALTLDGSHPVAGSATLTRTIPVPQDEPQNYPRQGVRPAMSWADAVAACPPTLSRLNYGFAAAPRRAHPERRWPTPTRSPTTSARGPTWTCPRRRSAASPPSGRGCGRRPSRRSTSSSANSAAAASASSTWPTNQG